MCTLSGVRASPRLGPQNVSALPAGAGFLFAVSKLFNPWLANLLPLPEIPSIQGVRFSHHIFSRPPQDVTFRLPVGLCGCGYVCGWVSGPHASALQPDASLRGILTSWTQRTNQPCGGTPCTKAVCNLALQHIFQRDQTRERGVTLPPTHASHTRAM